MPVNPPSPQYDSANVAVCVDDFDFRRCNACMTDIDGGVMFFQIRIRQTYSHVCAACASTIGAGIARGMQLYLKNDVQKAGKAI